MGSHALLFPLTFLLALGAQRSGFVPESDEGSESVEA